MFLWAAIIGSYFHVRAYFIIYFNVDITDGIYFSKRDASFIA